MSIRPRSSGLAVLGLVAAALAFGSAVPREAAARATGITTATPNPGPTLPPGTPPSPAPRTSGGEVPTPAPYTSLDGLWEVQLQNGAHTLYSHFKLHQAGQDVSGIWLTEGKQLPIAGTYDGRAFRFEAKDAAGAMTFTGYSDDSAEMVGLLDRSGNSTPFTASHRSSTLAAPRAEHRGHHK